MSEGSGPAPAEHEDAAVAPILFVGVSLVLGIASRHLLRGTRVPYTVALLLLGIGLGALEYGSHNRLGLLGDSIRAWSNINPNLILMLFLPALLFESSFAMEIHQIKRCIVQMILLAVPGVVISTFVLGTAIRYLFPFGWNWKISLLLGGLLSATDPVAVVALLKELGASKKISTIIEGESLMNDGTAIVVFKLFFEMVSGQSFTVPEVIQFLTRVALGAVAVGLAFGLVSFLWLGVIFNDTIIEITLTLTVSYLAYFTAESEAAVSGVLTVMTLGMFYAAVARMAFKGESQQSLHHFWEMVSYIANTIIFILSGVVIAESILHNQDFITDQSWAYLILLYVILQVSRVVVVVVLYPGLKYFGYGLDIKEAMILIWSGLRGAVALALSLILNRSIYHSFIPGLTHKTGALFVFFTGGVVFLTLVINGSTTQFLLHFLGMDKSSETKLRILEYTRFEMHDKALESFQELGDDEELGPADWPSVVKYITCLKEKDGVQIHPHDTSGNEEGSNRLQMQDTRLRLLNGVQAAYWGMLDEGRITQTSAMLLMQSVEEAIDAVPSQEALHDWRGLQAHVHFPSYFKNLRLRLLPQKIITFFTVERLELACYICAAFLRAHRIARRHLHEFLGESEVAEAVIRESEVEGEPAKQFLQDVQLTFPEVLRAVKTKQVTYSILQHLTEYVQNLEKTGLLEAKEMNQIHECVQTDLKKLLRNPPLVRMPSVSEILKNHPLIGLLPSNVRQPLRNYAKETMVMRGNSLYQEGSIPDGIWLITNGVLQWRSNSIANRHMLHPIFAHGSTLGLYETLTGKLRICELTADSVVHCFFIEKERVLSALRSVPEIEDFFWKESAMVVAKLVLPQQFEELSMQEMRALVLEHSDVRVYLRGEMIEVRHNDIAILLEGFVKQEGKEEVTMAPAALLPSLAEKMSKILDGKKEIASEHGSWFQADARTRVIFIECSGIQKDAGVNRTSSFLSGVILPRRHSHDHEGLVSWPEKQYVAGESSDRKDGKQLSQRLSERAMQLSFFGSTMNVSKYKRRGSNLKVQWAPWPRSKSDHTNGTLMKRPYSASALPPVNREGKGCGNSRGLERKLKSHGWINTAHPPLHDKSPPVAKEVDYSSDDSDAEEEHIVHIDSPSYLFRH